MTHTHTHTHIFYSRYKPPRIHVHNYVIPSIYDASLVEPLTKLYNHIYKQQFNICAEP